MIKLSIKNRWTGSIIFEYEKENNNIKETLLEAVKQCADLRGAYLQGADLQGAYLQGADLRGADLRGAYLQGADLQGAYLQCAYLQGADLQGAYLQCAYLQGADLQGADLRGAYLQGADLQGAYLQCAYLQGAYLQCAYLQGADLQGEKIYKAVVFTGLYDYIVIPYITEEGIKRIKMGCHNRTLEEWNNDFWNNPNEFPNDNSEKSNLRMMAFETAKKWFEIVE